MLYIKLFNSYMIGILPYKFVTGFLTLVSKCTVSKEPCHDLRHNRTSMPIYIRVLYHDIV